MKNIYLFVALGFIFLLVAVPLTMAVINLYFEKSSDFPPETLESCQKQRAILMEGIKQLEGSNGNN